MKWWEGKKTWNFIPSHAAHGKCDAAWQQTRRRWRQTRRPWRQIWRILTHFYGVTERSCIFSVTIDLTHWPNMDLWRHVHYDQLITYSWLCKLNHTPHYYSTSLMNIQKEVIDPCTKTKVLRFLTQNISSKARNWPGCEDESVAVFGTLMRKETETTIVNLSAFCCINIQPRLVHYITRRATEFVNPLLAFQQVGKFWSFPVQKEVIDPGTKTKVLRFLTQNISSKARNWPGCEDESVAVFGTLMRKETETTIEPPEFAKIYNPRKDDNIDFKYWPGWV